MTTEFVTADEARLVEFGRTGDGDSYDRAQVEAFLERVLKTLKHYEELDSADASVHLIEASKKVADELVAETQARLGNTTAAIAALKTIFEEYKTNLTALLQQALDDVTALPEPETDPETAIQSATKIGQPRRRTTRPKPATE